MYDATAILLCVALAFAAATYLGALAALVRPDHRNPVTKRVIDWLEGR